jgi:hypothetical protein
MKNTTLSRLPDKKPRPKAALSTEVQAKNNCPRLGAVEGIVPTIGVSTPVAASTVVIVPPFNTPETYVDTNTFVTTPIGPLILKGAENLIPVSPALANDLRVVPSSLKPTVVELTTVGGAVVDRTDLV